MKNLALTFCDLQRRPMFYLFTMWIPCLMVSCVALLCFFMPSGAGERINLGITSLLATCVFLSLVAKDMPPTSGEKAAGRLLASVTRHPVCRSAAAARRLLWSDADHRQPGDRLRRTHAQYSLPRRRRQTAAAARATSRLRLPRARAIFSSRLLPLNERSCRSSVREARILGANAAIGALASRMARLASARQRAAAGHNGDERRRRDVDESRRRASKRRRLDRRLANAKRRRSALDARAASGSASAARLFADVDAQSRRPICHRPTKPHTRGDAAHDAARKCGRSRLAQRHRGGGCTARRSFRERVFARPLARSCGARAVCLRATFTCAPSVGAASGTKFASPKKTVETR